jgi:hypothetical protein
MVRALVNHSRNGEFCSSCANRSINSRRSCGVSALTSLIILLSASVDMAVSTLSTIYHTDHEGGEGQYVNIKDLAPKFQKRGQPRRAGPQPCESVALNEFANSSCSTVATCPSAIPKRFQLTTARRVLLDAPSFQWWPMVAINTSRAAVFAWVLREVIRLDPIILTVLRAKEWHR